MTQGLRRFQQTGNLHFITFSCYHRQRHLGRAVTLRLFESALERVRKRYNFVVIGCVVLPEHVQLLVSETKITTLDRAIQALKLSVARKTKVYPFWQARETAAVIG
jgi:putative transposase